MAERPIDFFLAMERGFARILAQPMTPAALIDCLIGQAFDWFEANIALQAADQPPLACEKGCPACCALRVTATAPEIFLLAGYLRLVDATPAGRPLALPDRVAEADAATRGVDEKRRLVMGRPCPILLERQCLLHPVRPLACRGHAAFQLAQCEAAARGEDVEVAVSEPHLTLRALIQNALQSALRGAGLAWGLYELNQGLALALADEGRLVAWLEGADSLAPPVADLDMAALGAAFDRLHRLN